MTLTAPTINPASETLRSFEPTKKEKNMHCLAITSGKGGVGKSNLAVNLSLELGSLGNRVTLLDADFGLANADLLCGITPKFHLGHVLSGLKEPHEINIPLSDTVSLIPGGSGIEELANLSGANSSYLFKKLQVLEEDLDFMLIDTAAGISENVRAVLLAASKVIIVTTPEPTSIVDAYATIKVILRHDPSKPISIVINDIVGTGGGEQAFLQISSAVQGFLNGKVELLGMIPHDSELSKAICEQVPVVQYSPSSPASRAIRVIAKQLHNQLKKDTSFAPQSFWNMLADREELV